MSTDRTLPAGVTETEDGSLVLHLEANVPEHLLRAGEVPGMSAGFNPDPLDRALDPHAAAAVVATRVRAAPTPLATGLVLHSDLGYTVPGRPLHPRLTGPRVCLGYRSPLEDALLAALLSPR